MVYCTIMKVNGKAGIFMEVYELPITPEESKNYHSFFYKLKALTVREWIRSYITAVIYAVVLCGVIYFISDTLFIRFWFDTPLVGKGVLFFFILFWRQHSVPEIYSCEKCFKSISLIICRRNF